MKILLAIIKSMQRKQTYNNFLTLWIILHPHQYMSPLFAAATASHFCDKRTKYCLFNAFNNKTETWTLLLYHHHRNVALKIMTQHKLINNNKTGNNAVL